MIIIEITLVNLAIMLACAIGLSVWLGACLQNFGKVIESMNYDDTYAIESDDLRARNEVALAEKNARPFGAGNARL